MCYYYMYMETGEDKLKSLTCLKRNVESCLTTLRRTKRPKKVLATAYNTKLVSLPEEEPETT